MHNGILHKRFLSFSPHSALSGLAQRTRSSLCSFAPLCTAHLWMPLASLSHPLRNRPRRHLRRPTVEQLWNPSRLWLFLSRTLPSALWRRVRPLACQAPG